MENGFITELELNKQEVNTVLNSISDTFFLLDANYRFLFLNSKAKQFLEEFPDKKDKLGIWDIFPLDQNSRLSSVLLRASQKKNKVYDQFYCPRHKRWFNIIAYKSGQGIAVLLTELSAQELADKKLKVSELRLKRILDAIPQIAYTTSSSTEELYLNKKWTEYTGQKWGKGMTMEWLNMVYPGDQENVIRTWEECLAKKSMFQAEYRIQNKAGEYRWHIGRALPLLDNNGDILLWIGTATDVQQQKYAEQKLQEEQHFILQIAEATPDLITVFDLNSLKYTYINRQMLPFWGYKARTLKNIHFNDLKQKLHTDDWETILKYHESFKKADDHKIKEIEFRVIDANGDWKWLRERGKVFQRDAELNVTHIISIIQEVTEKKESEERLKQNDILKTLIEKKDEFMSIASHELKTPITTMKASLQILKRLVLKDTDKNTLLVFVEKANQQMNKIISLITDLMDNTKIQAGKLQLNLTEFKISDVISDSIIHNSNSHHIIVNDYIDRNIVADKIRLEQVLINFITNAVKYSPDDEEIYIDVVEEEDFIRVSVIDSGIGIPKEKLAHLFDRFYRVDDASAQFTGLGLGLYICAEIIRRHHGEYGVESKPGKGSTFWFRIPIKQTI